MDTIPHVPYIDIRVPHTTTEQEFLRLAVQAAARRFRELHTDPGLPIRHPGAEVTATPPQVG